MLVGPGGVGKSSLLRGLMNKPLPQVANSTQLADLITVKPQQKPITQQLITKATDKTMPWIKVTDDDEINEIVGLILLVANVEKGVTESSRFRQYLEGAAAYAASKIRRFHGHNITDDFRQQISGIKNDVVREVFSRAIEQARINPHAQAPESEIVTNVWDCAGQLVYLDILSAFLTPKTIFMLLYDARKNLDDRCIIVSHHRGQVTEEQEQNMSYLEMLFQWMASIHVTLTDNTSGSIPEYPHVITIGTHGDDPQVEADKSKVIKRLFNKCEGKAFTHLIRKGYIVNNSSAGKGDNEDSTFKKLRKDVYEFASQPSVTIATPVAWVLFRKIMQRAALTKPILSREEVLEIALSCSIPPESFNSLLKFYHDVAVFLYFDHVPSMKDYVIGHPQWLVKQLAKLLALEGFEEYHNPALWNLLREKGILMEPLYTQVWKESGLPDEAIMDLLEKCGLAAPIDTQGKVHPFTGKEYFVPSALPLRSESQLIISTQNSVKEACTLHLLFSTRYVPPGYLIRLVTALSRNKKCHISFSHGMYRNQFMLDFAGDEQNYIDEITVSQHITSVHVNVSRLSQRRHHNPPFSITCHEITKIILACSSEVEQWLPSIKVSTALACNKCSTDDHFIEIDPDTTTTLSQLKCQGNKVCTFNPSQQYWLQISPRDEVK
jgi:GTPase SAR1 family protein